MGGWSIDKFVKIDLNGISQSYNLEDLHMKVEAAVPLSLDEITDKEKELRGQNPQKSFRGKFEIEFFLKLLRKFICEANESKKEN